MNYWIFVQVVTVCTLTQVLSWCKLKYITSFFTVLDANNCVVSSSCSTTTTNTNSNNNTTSTTCSTKNTGTSEAHIPPLLGVAPLGPAQLTVEHELQFKMLQAAFFHMPHPSDSERLRLHLPRQPCQTPLYYPQVSLWSEHCRIILHSFPSPADRLTKLGDSLKIWLWS